MTHSEWVKEVKKALIDKDSSVVKMAVALDRSPEWVRRCLSGRVVNLKTVTMISNYLGIKNYLEG